METLRQRRRAARMFWGIAAAQQQKSQACSADGAASLTFLADRVGFEPTSRLRDYLISRFYSNPPKTGSFRPFKTIVEKFVNAKIMLFSLFLPVGKNSGKNSGKNKIRRILI